MPEPRIITHPYDIAATLAALGPGLSRDSLKEALLKGLAAKRQTSPWHPITAAGYNAWAGTVFGLRFKLVPQGWIYESKSLWEIVAYPPTQAVIAVASGDSDTGRPDGMPCTKREKGPQAEEAIRQVRQAQLPLSPASSDDSDSPNCPLGNTWFLLYFFDEREIRFELSMPAEMNAKHQVSNWLTRAIFDPLPLHPIVDPTPDFGAAIDVPVRRKKRP